MQRKSVKKVYNVGSGKTVSVNRIVELLKEKKYLYQKDHRNQIRLFADISLIKKEIGWSPKIDIKQGLKKILNDIQYWKNAPVWTPLSIKKETKDWFKYLKKKI